MRILCDLGGTYVRFCVSNADLLSEPKGKVSRYLVRDFTRDEKPFQAALKRFLQETRTDAAGTELRLSLPGEVTGTLYRFNNLQPKWQINTSTLRDEFRFSHVRAWNDAVAAFHSLFIFLGEETANARFVKILRKGSSAEKGRLVLVSPGTGLGVAGAYLQDQEDAGKFWTPIPSEFGSTRGLWDDDYVNQMIRVLESERLLDRSIQMLSDVEFQGNEKFRRKEYILSGLGIIRLYYAAQYKRGGLPSGIITIDKITKPDAIIRSALSGKDEDGFKVLNLFCRELAHAVFDLCLTLTVKVGVFLHGSIVNSIGAHGLQKFGFLETFEKRCQAEGFGKTLPIYLIDHPYLELVGLNRFKDLTHE